MRKRAQTEDVCVHCLNNENAVIIPNAPHREHHRAEEDVLALYQLRSDFPDENDEDFGDCSHREASI